jgi:PAS domain S-box-containing protein
MEESSAQPARADARLFYDAFKASPIGIALDNMEGRPLFVNPALCTMLGFSEEEICRKHCVEFSPPEDAAKDWALFEQLRSGSRKHYSLEKRFFRRDGSLFPGRLNIFLLNHRPYPVVVAMVEELVTKESAQEQVSQSQADLQKLAGHLIQQQEEERTAFAYELRDSVDRLMLLSATLARLQQELPQSADEVKQTIDESRQQLLNFSNEIYSLSHRLHSWKLEFLGLTKAAAGLCTELADREKVEIDFASSGVPEGLSKEISRSLFRFLQEALLVAMKNSVSRKFQVSLSVEAGEIHEVVRDEGAAFSPQRIMTEDALTFAGMKERLRLVDGEVSIESRLQATAIHARAPLHP